MDFALLVDYAPLILILGGVTVISWLPRRFVRSVAVVGEPAGWLVNITSLFGFSIGILLIATAAVAWSMEAPQVDTGTGYLLIVTGLALFLKPMKNISWAILIGLAVGGFCAGFVFLFYPLPETVYGFSSTWIYLVIFLIPALFMYLLFKFVEDTLRLVGTVLTFKPVTLTLGLLCIAQGILLLLKTSLFTILFS